MVFFFGEADDRNLKLDFSIPRQVAGHLLLIKADSYTNASVSSHSVSIRSMRFVASS